MKQRGFCFLFLILLSLGCNRSSSPHYARVLLNEIVPDNGRFGMLTAAGEEVTPDYVGETITPDWIELYNPGEAPVDLSGYYLSDNEESLRKWRFPAGVRIEAKGYLIVWTGDDFPGKLSASFGLTEATGETVVIASPDGYTILDEASFPSMERDIAWARLETAEGETVWKKTARPTPEGPNLAAGLYVRFVDVSPLYPYTPVTFTVAAPGKGAGSDVVLHFRIDYEDNEWDAGNAWQSEVMTRVSGEDDLYRFTLTGRGLTSTTWFQYYVTTTTDDGLFVFDPPVPELAEDETLRFERPRPDSCPDLYVFQSRIAGGGTGKFNKVAVTEIMPWNATYQVRTDSLGTPGWFEIYNFGQKQYVMEQIKVWEVFSGQFDTEHRDSPLYPDEFKAGGRWIFITNSDTGNEELNFRLPSSAGELVLQDDAGNTVSRLTYCGLAEDRSFGRFGEEPYTFGRVFETATPKAPNGDWSAWFSGRPSVWVDWDDDGVKVVDDSVIVHAAVSWHGAWRDAAKPDVMIHYADELAGGEDAVVPMDFVGEAASFQAYVPVAGADAPEIVRYAVEVVDFDGVSLWHSAGGVSEEKPPRSWYHAFSTGAQQTGVRINEVGLVPEGYDGGSVYSSYDVPDSAGTVERRRAYIELYNGGDAPFSLAGTYISIFDRKADGNSIVGARFLSEEHLIDSGVIEPGGYYVFEVDGGFHDRPSLFERYEGNTVSLYRSLENGNGVIDRLSFDVLENWKEAGAFGTMADPGQGDKQPPSPGAPNLVDPPNLTINEIYWSADEKWVELHLDDDKPFTKEWMSFTFTVTVRISGLPAINYSCVVDVTKREEDLAPGSFLTIEFEGESVDVPVCFINQDIDNMQEIRCQVNSPAWPWRQNDIDMVSVPIAEIPETSSWGRFPDGEGDFTVCQPTLSAPNSLPGVLFIRGDCNEDGTVDLRDAAVNDDLAALIAYLDGTGPLLACEDRCDLNDDGMISIADISYFTLHIISAGEPDVPAPFPDPGIDPTEDSLQCE